MTSTPDILSMAGSCTTPAQLADFIDALIADEQRNPENSYRNNMLGPQSYECMSAWICDAAPHEPLSSDAIRWFATVILAGVSYE